MIARNCHGLPLAIVVIGGILSKVDRTQDAWSKIKKSVGRTVNTGNLSFKKILSLSYDHLPHHLRPCFLYIGGFPEDCEIQISNLIKLWVAEGFLKPSRSKSLEEVAKDNLEDLLKRHLILVTRKCSNGQIRTLKVHDLLRDLCLEKAQEEKFLHPCNSEQGMKNLDRRSFCLEPSGFFGTIASSASYGYIFHKHKKLSCRLQGFQLLRVLNALSLYFKEFPIEVVELFHLRYFAFTFVKNKEDLKFPSSLLKLQNLQTLIVRPGFSSNSSTEKVYLPVEVWWMPELRHLIWFKSFLPDPSDDVLALINLQTLSSVTDLRCTERILNMIPNLKKLGLCYSFYSFKRGWSEFELYNLVYFHQLEKLNIKSFVNPNPLSRNLVSFPPSLKKLTLAGLLLRWKDMTIVGSLPNLEVLKLKGYRSYDLEWETNEGEFRKLKMLLIERTSLSHWIVDSPTHFPKLEHLVLDRCFGLEEIPRGIGEIPTLKLIEVSEENKSLLDSAKWIQEEQQSYGNDVLQVRIYEIPIKIWR